MLGTLPSEILAQVFYYAIESEDLPSICLTCKRFYDIAFRLTKYRFSCYLDSFRPKRFWNSYHSIPIENGGEFISDVEQSYAKDIRELDIEIQDYDTHFEEERLLQYLTTLSGLARLSVKAQDDAVPYLEQFLKHVNPYVRTTLNIVVRPWGDEDPVRVHEVSGLGSHITIGIEAYLYRRRLTSPPAGFLAAHLKSLAVLLADECTPSELTQYFKPLVAVEYMTLQGTNIVDDAHTVQLPPNLKTLKIESMEAFSQRVCFEGKSLDTLVCFNVERMPTFTNRIKMLILSLICPFESTSSEVYGVSDATEEIMISASTHCWYLKSLRELIRKAPGKVYLSCSETDPLRAYPAYLREATSSRLTELLIDIPIVKGLAMADFLARFTARMTQLEKLTVRSPVAGYRPQETNWTYRGYIFGRWALDPQEPRQWELHIDLSVLRQFAQAGIDVAVDTEAGVMDDGIEQYNHECFAPHIFDL